MVKKFLKKLEILFVHSSSVKKGQTAKKISFYAGKIFLVLSAVVLLYTAISAIFIVILGNFSFWFDPARDLLLALSNLRKPTLIGPPSGIPGIFYGPYWIWLLSIILIISKDPRFVIFVIGILFYMVLFPFFLLKFSTIFSKTIIIALLVFFTFGNFFSYTTNMWNPNIAPLLFLILSLLISRLNYSLSHNSFLKSFAIGIFVALIMNFHLSFGTTVLVGTSLYMILYTGLLFKKNIRLRQSFLRSILMYFCFVAGVILVYLPFLFFELRHNFLQTKELYKTVSDSILYNTVEVGQHGLDKFSIFRTFVGNFGQTIQIHEFFVYVAFIFFQIYIFVLRKRGKFKQFTSSLREDRNFTTKVNLLVYLLFVLFSTFTIYFLSKNPIWAYHFIGVDILFLLLFGIIMSFFPKIKRVIFLWLVLYIIMQIPHFYSSFTQNIHVNPNISSLSVKKEVVQEIFRDANGKPFLVAAYDPAIYTYDFDYLFAWIGKKKLTKDPKEVLASNNPIYLIVPRKQPAIELDFVHYMSTDSAYITIKSWTVGGDIRVIERVKNKF